MPPRRLPNGRFAKVTQLPEAKRRTKPKAEASIVITTNARDIARKALPELRQRVPAGMLQTATDRARDIEARLRATVLASYTRAATGRAARGISAKVDKSKVGDKDQVVIRVTFINYREFNFITNLAGNGYFKSFPIGPYKIFARGAQEQFERINSETGEVSYLRSKSAAKRLGGKAKGRLKIPRGGSFLATVPGRGGVESREVRDVLGPSDPGDLQSAFFFYPLWVTHPGFDRDVIADTVLAERGQFVEEMIESVSVSHRTGMARIEREAEMVVSDEIPIPSITLSRTGFRSGFDDRSGGYTLDAKGRRIR